MEMESLQRLVATSYNHHIYLYLPLLFFFFLAKRYEPPPRHGAAVHSGSTVSSASPLHGRCTPQSPLFTYITSDRHHQGGEGTFYGQPV